MRRAAGGACFVFDERVRVDAALQETGPAPLAPDADAGATAQPTASDGR